MVRPSKSRNVASAFWSNTRPLAYAATVPRKGLTSGALPPSTASNAASGAFFRTSRFNTVSASGAGSKRKLFGALPPLSSHSVAKAPAKRFISGVSAPTITTFCAASSRMRRAIVRASLSTARENVNRRGRARRRVVGLIERKRPRQVELRLRDDLEIVANQRSHDDLGAGCPRGLERAEHAVLGVRNDDVRRASAGGRRDESGAHGFRGARIGGHIERQYDGDVDRWPRRLQDGNGGPAGSGALSLAAGVCAVENAAATASARNASHLASVLRARQCGKADSDAIMETGRA